MQTVKVCEGILNSQQKDWMGCVGGYIGGSRRLETSHNNYHKAKLMV